MLFAGTSSYSLKTWVGPFYPPGTPSSGYLRYYASRLNTVEINYTFRRFPTEKLSASWAAQTPPGFRFSLKMHQSVTHFSRLKNIGEPLEAFLRNVEPLGARLGVILIQLPPSLAADAGALADLLARLPRGLRAAFEFRHPSWHSPDIMRLLEKSKAALCVAQHEILHRLPPPTAPFVYLRIRKPPPYSSSEEDLLRAQVRDISRRVDEVYCYLKHDDAGLAPAVAAALGS